MSGKYEPSIIAIDGPLAYSQRDVMMYARLPALPYEFIQTTDREMLAREMTVGLAGLATSNEESVECQLIVTSVPFDHNMWASELERITKKNRPKKAWAKLLDDMHYHVYSQGFRSREVYLGVKLGDRSDFRGKSGFTSLKDASNMMMKFFGVNDRNISEAELEFWREKADTMHDVIGNQSLRGVPVSGEIVARLVKETLWPNMPMDTIEPMEKWGKGEIDSLGIYDVYNNSKYIKIKQFRNGKELEGYRATLCFSRFPDEIDYPSTEPWIHITSLLPFPTIFSSRFTLEPTMKVQKILGRKVKDAMDQGANAGSSTPIEVQEAMVVAEELQYSLSRDKTPWLFGRHRLTVVGATKRELESNVQSVIDLYKKNGIEIVWPSGDQLDLLLESQPGDRVRTSAYLQNQELGIIPVGMPSGSGKVGDAVHYTRDGKRRTSWLGPYMGYTLSRVEEPFFLSLHSAIANNNPPGCVITGAPGGGKTFAGLTLTYLMACQNIWTIMIDPKGDSLSMLDLPGLETANTFDLKDGNDGLLDPFRLATERPEQMLLVLEVIKLFTANKMDSREENALNEALTVTLNDCERTGESPSLFKVLQNLKKDPSDHARRLSNQLNIISQLPFARLCFAKSSETVAIARPEDGLTVFSLKGLDLPATPKQESYTTKNWLAVGIMYLLANYTESLMNSSDQKHQKAVVIDEAWAITSTPQGASLIERLARLGRSLNTGIVCISQNAGDFLELTNSMPYRLAFGTKDTGEINNVCKFLGLEHGDDGKPLRSSYETIATLNRGECIVRDPDNRIQKVYIDNWNETIFQAIDTNPESKKELKKKVANAA